MNTPFTLTFTPRSDFKCLVGFNMLGFGLWERKKGLKKCLTGSWTTNLLAGTFLYYMCKIMNFNKRNWTHVLFFSGFVCVLLLFFSGYLSGTVILLIFRWMFFVQFHFMQFYWFLSILVPVLKPLWALTYMLCIHDTVYHQYWFTCIYYRYSLWSHL